MAQQNLDFNIAANVKGMEAIATLINRVGALENETKKLASANAALSNSTDAVIRNGVRYNNALDAQSKELRNARQGTQQLGMQFNDLATSISTGASPIQAFNQQLGQIGYALSMMGGTAGRVGEFLAGPWGAAILVATMALGPMISKLFEASEETKKLQKSAESLDEAVAARKASEQGLQLALAKTASEYRKIRLEMQANAITAVNAAKVELNARLKVLTGLMAEQQRMEEEVRGAGGLRAGAEMGTGQITDRFFNSRATAQAITSVKAQTAELEKLTGKLNAATVDVVQAAARADRAGGRADRGGKPEENFSNVNLVEREQVFIGEILRKGQQHWQEYWDNIPVIASHAMEKIVDINTMATASVNTLGEQMSKDWLSRYGEIQQSFTSVGNAVANSFQGMLTGAMSWKDGMKGIINAVINELWRLFVVQQIVGLVTGGLNNLFGFNVAGARAAGGPVTANKPYLVGEKGPEIVVPGSSGTVIPNRHIGQAQGGGAVTINVDARGSADPAAVRAQVQQGIIEAAPSIIAAAEARTVQGLRRPRLGGAIK